MSTIQCPFPNIIIHGNNQKFLNLATDDNLIKVFIKTCLVSKTKCCLFSITMTVSFAVGISHKIRQKCWKS